MGAGVDGRRRRLQSAGWPIVAGCSSSCPSGGFLRNIVYTLAKPFSSTPEQGADSLIWLATSPEAAALKGEYVSKRRPARPQKQALDPKLAGDLWTLSERLCAEAAARAA